ncbi:MAG: protease modulator HflC [Magnetococcales bacterium]|nr:protease modulator HflC [Magnetococcales bacterium]
MKPIHMIFGITGIIALILVANSAFIVTETDRALVLSLGKVDRRVEEPGLYFRRPFIQQLVKYDDRVLDLDSTPEEIVTKDKKRLVVDTFMRWRIEDATKFYETQRTMSSGRAQLNTIMSSATKRSLARHDAQDIISGERRNIMNSILAETREEASRFGIEVLDVRIKRADLPAENSQAVYNRMRAERNKEAKEIRAGGEEEAQKIRANAERERTILIADAENKSQMLRGSGDADAIKIFADAFGKSPEFYRLTRTLDAYRRSLAKENAMLVVDPETDFLKIFEQGQ